MTEFKIDNNKIGTGFNTPENYFDAFSVDINSETTFKEPKVFSFPKRKKWYYAVAASVIIFLSVTYFIRFTSNNNLMLSNSEIENYLSSSVPILDEDLVLLLNENAINNLNIEFNVQENEIENELYSDSNLEQYIIN